MWCVLGFVFLVFHEILSTEKMVVVCAWFRQVFTGMAQHAPYFAEKDNIQGKIRNTKKEKRIYQKNRLNLERKKRQLLILYWHCKM